MQQSWTNRVSALRSPLNAPNSRLYNSAPAFSFAGPRGSLFSDDIKQSNWWKLNSFTNSWQKYNNKNYSVFPLKNVLHPSGYFLAHVRRKTGFPCNCFQVYPEQATTCRCPSHWGWPAVWRQTHCSWPEVQPVINRSNHHQTREPREGWSSLI